MTRTRYRSDPAPGRRFNDYMPSWMEDWLSGPEWHLYAWFAVVGLVYVGLVFGPGWFLYGSAANLVAKLYGRPQRFADHAIGW